MSQESQEGEVKVHVMLAAIAAVIAHSRDHGLNAEQYKYILTYLPAATKNFREHRKKRKA